MVLWINILLKKLNTIHKINKNLHYFYYLFFYCCNYFIYGEYYYDNNSILKYKYGNNDKNLNYEEAKYNIMEEYQENNKTNKLKISENSEI